MQPTIPQLILLALAVGLFLIGGVMSLGRLHHDRPALRAGSRVCLYGGLLASAAVLAWHSASRGDWQPIHDNFDSLIWLGLILVVFLIYIQRFKPISGMDWFVMPVVVMLLIAAGVFGRAEFHSYKTSIGKDTWMWAHVTTAFAGAVAFAIAAAGGAMYMLAARRLRKKTPGGPKLFGSLELLERTMMVAVTLGFALLTVSLIMGFFRMFDRELRMPHPKLLLAMLAWVVYAVVMHAPINPRFRGRRAAMLSVLGFALVIATLVVVQFMPGGNR